MKDRIARSAVSRRSLLISGAFAAGALTVGFSLAGRGRQSASPEAVSTELNNWVVVTPQNRVVLRIGQMEMGQGTITMMAQLLAEELEPDWSTIGFEFVPIWRNLGQSQPFGRTTTEASFGLRDADVRLRTAGAQVRMMLTDAAAARWRVPSDRLVARNGEVVDTKTSRSLSYGELASEAAALPVPDARSVRLKDTKDWRYVGRSVPRLDLPGKVAGAGVFGIDVQLDGMVFAAVAACPYFGGSPRVIAAQALTEQPGVRRVVVLDEPALLASGSQKAVAVVAGNWWDAKRALDSIPIEWDDPFRLDDETISAHLRAGLEGAPYRVLRRDGDPAEALRQASSIVEADYVLPYLEHGTLEPMNATAVVRDDGFEVWAPTQAPEEAQRVAASIADMPVEKGRLHPTQMGGAFGRRLHSDAVAQAVAVAKTMRGTPVKLVWSREETTRHGVYRQSAMVRMRAGFDADGRLVAWSHRISGQTKDDRHAMVNSTYGADSILFSIPNILVEWAAEPLGVPVGLMRGVGNSIDVFAIQSFLDELAREAGTDAYRFQRGLLDPTTTPADVPILEFDQPLPSGERASRLRNVLDEAAKRSGWDTPMPRGRGRGIAAHEYQGGFYAVVIEITLDGRGGLRVDRVLVVVDVGMLGNPRNAQAQVEGGVAFGLSSALYGRISIQDGMVLQGNFDTYELLRADAMPNVEIHWITGREFWGDASQGVVSAVAPALANAIYDAGRPRIRKLPIHDHNLQQREG